MTSLIVSARRAHRMEWTADNVAESMGMASFSSGTAAVKEGPSSVYRSVRLSIVAKGRIRTPRLDPAAFCTHRECNLIPGSFVARNEFPQRRDNCAVAFRLRV